MALAVICGLFAVAGLIVGAAAGASKSNKGK
jgi:hypothetical protein